MSQIVDTETAQEFMKETLDNISRDTLSGIAGDLALKSALFSHILAPDKLPSASEQDLHRILRAVFSTRRMAADILKTHPAGRFRELVTALLYGKDPLEDRFLHFYNQMEGLPDHLRYDLAGELLHFSQPESAWLWCRWLWDPKTRTGSMPLLVTEDVELNGANVGETYLNLGKATAFVHNVGEAAGFQTISRSLFGTDVFLCAVYVIYTYTVLRMRMTQEFNKVVPGLEEFSRRLLGVHHLDELEITL